MSPSVRILTTPTGKSHPHPTVTRRVRGRTYPTLLVDELRPCDHIISPEGMAWRVEGYDGGQLTVLAGDRRGPDVLRRKPTTRVAVDWDAWKRVAGVVA